MTLMRVAVAGQRLVDRVVDGLVHEVMQAVGAGVADVHGRALADRLESLEDLDVARGVRSRRVMRRAIPPAVNDPAGRTAHGERLRRGQEYLLGGLDLLQHVARTSGSSSDSASSSSSTGAVPAASRHRQHLGEPQRERQQPLLAPRAEHSRIHAVELDRPGHRGAGRPASGPGASPRPRPLEGRHERGRLGRLARARSDTPTWTLAARRPPPDRRARSRSASAATAAGADRSAPCPPRPAARPTAPRRSSGALGTCSRRFRCPMIWRYAAAPAGDWRRAARRTRR